MALSQGLIDTYWRRYNQRKALTGFGPTYQEQRGALDPMMEAAANKDVGEAQARYQHDIQNRQLSLQEEAQSKADRAATISGIANTGGLLASAYLTNKSITNTASNNARLLSLLESKGAGSGGMLPSGGVGSGAALTPPGALQAPGYAAPTIAGPTSFAEAGAPAAAATAPGAGSALLSAAPQIGALYGAQYALGKATKSWMDDHGMKNTNTGWTYAGLPGAMAGGSVDLAKKGFSEISNAADSVGSFMSDVFGW